MASDTQFSHGATPFLGFARLMRLNMSGTDLSPLAQQLIQRASADPTDAAALLDASTILYICEQNELAQLLQREALKTQRHYVLPSARPARLRVLALKSPGKLMVNVPLECLLENSDIELHIYYPHGPDDDLSAAPEHDLLFVTICETEDNRPLLQGLSNTLRHWHRPVLNRPENIPNVARNTASRLLADAPGVLMPKNLRLPRSALQSLAATDGEAAAHSLGLSYPLTVRPLDTHAGDDLHQVNSPADLAAVLPHLPGDEGFVAPFVDYRNADGQFRKYRIMLIGGQPFVAHAAISSHWMIHYLNAGMATDAAKRAEEAEFMGHFDHAFAQRHASALQSIYQRMGLDYLGIDCSETPDGRLLVFEVDHAMVVHDMDPVDLYPYKPAIVHKLFAAFRTLLLERSVSRVTA